MIKVSEVNDNKSIKRFIDFQHELYKDDPYYVPELFLSQKEMFDRKKYPFYKFADNQAFLAYKGDKIVGRIVAISNPRYNEYHDSNVGFIGFFDFENSLEVAQALLDAAKNWLSKFNYDRILGPTNFTTNETAGVLVDGFDSSPTIMMTYNKAYYHDIYTDLGFKKEMDLFAYMIYTKKANDKSIRLAGLIEDRIKNQGITIRNINLKNFKAEVAQIKKVYNQAWDKNWGFVPFTDDEFDHLADGLKMLADEKWGYVAEANGEMIGFSITLPNINEITKGFKKGRLLPFNVFKLLFRRRKTNVVRITATGVLKEYRKKGIEAIFFAKNILTARAQNKLGGEASWVLESNQEMNQAAIKLNGEKYKTYRIYSLEQA